MLVMIVGIQLFESHFFIVVTFFFFYRKQNCSCRIWCENSTGMNISFSFLCCFEGKEISGSQKHEYIIFFFFIQASDFFQISAHLPPTFVTWQMVFILWYELHLDGNIFFIQLCWPSHVTGAIIPLVSHIFFLYFLIALNTREEQTGCNLNVN